MSHMSWFFFLIQILLFAYIYIYIFFFCCSGPSLLCMGFSLVVRNGICSVVALHRLLSGVPSPFVKYRLYWDQASVVAPFGLNSWSFQAVEHRLNSCGTAAQLFWGMRIHPRPGIKLVSDVLAGGGWCRGGQQESREFLLLHWDFLESQPLFRKGSKGLFSCSWV